MRKRTLGVVLLAGLAMSGAGAFTASNTVTAIDGGTANVGGYAEATVSGATVTAINYVQDPLNASLMDTVEFWATGDLVGKDASVRLLDTASGTPSSVGNYSCDTGTTAASGTEVLPGVTLPTGTSTKFVCATADEPIADFEEIGITVNN